jgi:hypothetical protein
VNLGKAICQGQIRNKKEEYKVFKEKTSNQFHVAAEAWNCSFH